MNKAVAKSTGHVVVDLGDNLVCDPGSGESGVNPDAEAAVTVRIGRRNLDESNIDGHLPAFEEALDFAEIDGGIVGAAVLIACRTLAPMNMALCRKCPAISGAT